jgi:hypothetical protein
VLLQRIRAERKKREETGKVLKMDRKGVKMNIAKRQRSQKSGPSQQELGLYEKLVEAGQPLSPEELFKTAGYKTDEQPESVEAFYEALSADVEDGLIAQSRPNNAHVLLAAREPSAEVLTGMEEEEMVLPVEKVQQREKMENQLTLWDV